MPIYEYKCRDCGNEYEELVFTQGTPPPCPRCASTKTEKLMSACSAKVDGGGPNFEALQDSGGCSGGG